MDDGYESQQSLANFDDFKEVNVWAAKTGELSLTWNTNAAAAKL